MADITQPMQPLTPAEEFERSRQQMEDYARAQMEAAAAARRQQQQQAMQPSLPTIAGQQAIESALSSSAPEAAASQLPAPGALAASEAENAAINAPGMAASNMGATPIYIPAAAAVTTALAGKSAMNMLKGKTDSSPVGKFGRASLDYATGGLAEVGNKALDLAGLHHKSTKEYEAERWGDLASNGGVDPDTAKYFQNLAHPEGDSGEGWTPEVAATAMKDAGAMAGQLGMQQTFGADYWTNMNEFQRYAATQAAIDAGLLKGDHGDILVTDPEKLKSIAPSYYADEKIQQQYNAWKAAQPKSSDGAQSMDEALSASLAGTNAQMRQDAKNSQLRSLMINAAQPISVPKFGGGVRTGVSSLDDILGGVLQ